VQGQRSALAYALAKLLHKFFATGGKWEYQKTVEPALASHSGFQHEHQPAELRHRDGLGHF